MAGEPDKYRLLRDGDLVEATDEWLQEDGQTWVKSPNWIIGMEYMRGRALLPARRELRSNA